MARGHITLNGKNYLMADESYESQMAALFRPQMAVEGISREALDQWLYMAQDKWDEGSNLQSQTDRWMNGGFGTIDGVDNTDGTVRLQPAVILSKTITGNHTVHLLAVGGFLFYFDENDGSIKRTTDGVNWTAVTYDYATYGKISSVDLGLAGTAAAVAGTLFVPVDAKLLIGTTEGKVFFANVGATLTPLNVWQIGSAGDRVHFAVMHRGAVIAGCKNRIGSREVSNTGTFAAGFKYQTPVQGVPLAASAWNQVIMAAVQVSPRGSLFVAADLNQIIDSYALFDGFVAQSLTTWGGQLVYGGFRQNDTSEVYAFRQTLAEELTSGDAPLTVPALLATAKRVLVAWNQKGGLWWVDDKGAGAFCQYASVGTANRVVEAITYFNGEIYYTLQDTGVMRVGAPATEWIAVATDDFTRADNQSLGANWTESESATDALKILSNQVTFGVAAGAIGCATYTGAATADDQFSRITYKSVSGASVFVGMAVGVRMSGTFGAFTGYLAVWDKTDATITLEKNVAADLNLGGTGTVLGTYAVVLAGDQVLQVDVVGSTLRVLLNDVVVITATDSTITTGDPGIAVRRTHASAGGSGYTCDDWEGGEQLTSNVYVTTGFITSNWFDGGFPELDKTFAEVFVRLDAPLGAAEGVALAGRVDADSSYTAIGSLATGDSYRFFMLPAALQNGKRIDLKLTLTGDGTSTPTVVSTILRYRTLPVQKRVWGLTLWASRNLQYLDGTFETRTPETIISDLFALQTAGQVQFSSVLEPTAKTVYVTNVQLKGQLLGKSKPAPFDREEGFVAVEILEV